MVECSNHATKEWHVWAGLFGNIVYVSIRQAKMFVALDECLD